MSAYRKFSDILRRKKYSEAPPKAPKPDHIEPLSVEALGGLGGLDGVAKQSKID